MWISWGTSHPPPPSRQTACGSAYRALLRTARVELYYCGSAPLERVEAALAAAFRDLPREETRTAAGVQSVGAHAAPGGPRLEEEAMDVTQGKLALGFRTGGLTAASPEFPALLVMNAVYGGTPTSKLFLNVREKLSLCYYASSMLEKFSGLMVVSSGIEFDKFEAAKAEILAQMENCRAGTIEEWELVGARQSVISTLRTTMDAQGRLEEHWLGQVVAELTEGPDGTGPPGGGGHDGPGGGGRPPSGAGYRLLLEGPGGQSTWLRRNTRALERACIMASWSTACMSMWM